MLEGRLESDGFGPLARAQEHLARRRGFRYALLGLALMVSLALYAPLLASDRPLYLEAVRRGEYERARRTLMPVAKNLASLLAKDEAAFLAARAASSSQTLAAARAGEHQALSTRIASLRASLSPTEGEPLAALEQELAAAVALAERGEVAAAAQAGDALAQRAQELREVLDPARVTLLPRRAFPAFAALAPLESGLMVAWLGVLLLPFLARRLGARRVLLASALLGALCALAANRGGDAFHTASYKTELDKLELEPVRVCFAPIPYGYAEQHPEEALRPPTWLAASELGPDGAYLRGGRAPRADPVTGFVPETRAIEVRAGEPAFNSPLRHVLGTDLTGRDLLARALHGARVSLAVGGLATALLLFIGTLVGALAGYFGGLLDLALSRALEVVVSFPLFFLVLVAVALVGPSMWNVVLVLGCVGWTGVARLARAEFQRQRELDYVAAARTLGFAWPRIVFRHVLPNALAPLLVAGTFAVASAILVEAGLSFLGYGVRVPIASWGGLSSESRELAHWWLQLFPGLFLFVTVLCVQLVGDALRDALDPRSARGGLA
ncbi:MAG: ABC transporter permease [Planctomycetes bacterium]|nr:ABC transporter permease [Planctomycetota bacterium]